MVKLQQISTPSSQTSSGNNSNSTSPTSSNQTSPTSPLPPPPDFTILPFLPLPHNLYHPPSFYPHQQPQPLLFYPFPTDNMYHYYYPPQQQLNDITTTTFYYYPQEVDNSNNNIAPQDYCYDNNPENTLDEFYVDAMKATTRGPRSGNNWGFGFRKNNAFYHGGGNNHVGNNFNQAVVKKVWKPKGKKGKKEQENPKKTLVKTYEIPAELSNCTTIMVKNIPNGIRREKFIELLDRHCCQQNSKNDKDNVSQSSYDFLYLPFDFVKGQNLGYAFINMTSEEGVAKLYKSWNNKGWYDSPKIRLITPAKLQGLAQCRRHFHLSTFICDTDQFLPLEFSPPRNGLNGENCKAKTIGKWICVNRLVKNCRNEGGLAKTDQPSRLRSAKTTNPPTFRHNSVK